MKFLATALFLTSILFSNVKVSVDAEKMGLEDNLSLVVDLEGVDDQPQIKSDDFDQAGASHSSQIQIVNGTISKKTVYQFELTPKRTGRLSFSVIVGGETKGPYSIEVVNGKLKPEVTPSNPFEEFFGRNPLADRNPPAQKPFADDEAFFRNEPEKNTFYVGEPIVLDTAMYRRVNVAIRGLVSEDSFTGLSFETLSEFDPEKKEVRVNGQIYERTLIRKRIIYSALPGKKNIVGGVLRAEKPGGFWGGPVRDFKMSDVELDVLPFPEVGKPNSFRGSVGDFNFRMIVDHENVKTHEPITLRLEVSGKGNFKLLSFPTFTYSNADMSIRKAATRENIKLEKNNWRGSVVVEYFLIAEVAGKYKIPPLTWSFFSPTRGYQIQTAAGFILTANASSGDGTSTRVKDANASEKNVEEVRDELSYIKTDPIQFQNVSPWRNVFLYISHFIMLLIIFGFYGWSWFQKKEGVFRSKNLQHHSAVSRLRGARSISQSEDFYRQLEDILQTYLTERFLLSRASSISEIKKQLSTSIDKFPEILGILELIAKSQTARYAPTHESSNLKESIDKAEALLEILEKNLSQIKMMRKDK